MKAKGSVSGYQARCTGVREVKCVSEGEGVRAPSQHYTCDAPQPLGISMFGLVPNRHTLDTTGLLSTSAKWVVGVSAWHGVRAREV